MKMVGFLFLCLSWLGCDNQLNFKSDKRTIILQPYSDFSTNETTKLLHQLKLIYPNIQINKAIPLPKNALTKNGIRYRADSLIRFLNHSTPKGFLTIGLTHQDISVTKNGIQDWGVMGLGYCPGNACIASTFRLSRKEKDSQFYKVAIHELGHTQGLPHCPEKTCFMRDAKGKNPTNEEKQFCEKCKKHLIKKGWNL